MKRTHALLTGTLLVACTSAPRDPGPSPAPPTAPTPTASDARPDPRTPQQPLPGTLPAARARTAKLDTGLSLVLTTLPPSHDALVQFGLLAGASAQAPGLAELTMHALLSSADASRGRPSLQAAIGSLGGTARVHGGLNSTWLELRVPGAKWSLAVQALRQALGAPQQSRHQLERVRDDLVAATVAAVAADPLGTMARQLLLGSDDTAAHCNDLIDRDAGEIGSFQARVLRPDRCVLAVDAPETSDRLLARLRSETEGFATWKPTATDPTELTNIERPFVGGIHWAPDGTDGPCRVALVIALPDLNRPDAAAAFLLHACITMDGNGGRFEQLLRERGLNGVHWRSEIVNTAEAAALVLRTEVTATDAVALWRTWTLARQSLGDVAPTAEERAFARRRAPLSARLQLLDAGSRSRTTARLARAERSLETLDAAFAALDADGGAAVLAATDYYRSLPSALVVLGGDPPPDLTEVRKFSPLQKGLAATAQAPTATTNAPETASATPWLERAIEAIGGRDRLLRLQGWRSECRIGTERHQ